MPTDVTAEDASYRDLEAVYDIVLEVVRTLLHRRLYLIT
jgi:hypothetical protein